MTDLQQLQQRMARAVMQPLTAREQMRREKTGNVLYEKLAS